MGTWQNIWIQFWSLMDYELQFPAPIGSMSPMDGTMFFAVAIMLADSVSMVASRRD